MPLFTDLQLAIEGRISGGESARAIARRAGLPLRAIQNIIEGHQPSLDRVTDICSVLGLEAYIGPPREGGSSAPAAQTPALPPEVAEALGLAEGASPAEAVKAIEARLEGGFDAEALRVEVAAAVKAETEALRSEIAATRVDIAGLVDATALAPTANDAAAPPDARPVAVFQVAAAAGGGALIEDAPPAGPAWFRRDWLDKYGIDPTRCVVIGVKGESMEPTLPDGCSILLDKTRVDLRAERIYAVTTSDGLVVKRAGKGETGDWVLSSDHPAWDDVPWSDDAETIGEVRWAGWSLS